MISCLTLTFQRHHILEECIESFLRQDFLGPSEMVIINDSPNVKYVYNHPKIRIINCDYRFSSIGKKLEYGLKLCRGEVSYRIDDDDLLVWDALSRVQSWIDKTPGMDVYRSSRFYWFNDNKYIEKRDGINTGNVLSKEYINRLVFPDKNADEDLDVVFGPNVKMLTVHEPPTMIYRWGGGTTHISTQLHLP